MRTSHRQRKAREARRWIIRPLLCIHQSVTSGRCTTMKRSLLAVIIAATAAPTLAEPIDATTPCSVAIHAFGSAKRAGEVLAGAPSQEVLEVGNYILNIMDQLDRQRTNPVSRGDLVELLGRGEARDRRKRRSQLSPSSAPDDP